MTGEPARPTHRPAHRIGGAGPGLPGVPGRRARRGSPAPLGPSAAETARLRRVALGDGEADLAVRGGKVLVVHTGETVERDVLICGRFIAAVTPYGMLPARRTLDAAGMTVLPGYLDVSLDVGHTLLTPGELARLVLPLGTTTVLAAPGGAVGAVGTDVLDLLTTTGTPLRVLVADRPVADRPAPARSVLDLASFGHVNHDVRAAVAGGTDPVDAVRAVTLGRARSAGLAHVLGSVNPSRFADLQLVTEVAACGPPEVVIVSGRIAAERGRPLFDNHDTLPAWVRDTVRVAPGLRGTSFAVPASGPRAWVQAADLITGLDAPLGEISMVGALCRTRAFHAHLEVVDGTVATDLGRDVLKIAVIERHRGDDAIGIGFVRGFGLRGGALAATTNDENGNIVVVGAEDEDMLLAVRALEGMGGGFAAVDRGWLRAACPLPVAGIAGDGRWETVLDHLVGVNAVAAGLGCPLPAPFLTLAFIGRSDVGDLGLTENGLVDVADGASVPVVLPVAPDGRPACRCRVHTADVHRLFDGSTP